MHLRPRDRELPFMHESPAPLRKSRARSTPRLALLAGVAGLGMGVLLAGSGFNLNSSVGGPVAHAQSLQRPVGFADIVDKAENVQVTADHGKIFQAKVIGTDARSDLATLKLEAPPAFPFANVAEG